MASIRHEALPVRPFIATALDSQLGRGMIR